MNSKMNSLSIVPPLYACIHCNITKPSKGDAGLLLMKAELFGDLVDTVFISGPAQHLQVFLLN